MRLPLIPPSELTPEQRVVYDTSDRTLSAEGLTSFRTKRDDGAFLGPWSVLMHFPALGDVFGRLSAATHAMTRLSPTARQVVILTVGGHFNAAYELYAHTAEGAEAGLEPGQIATLCAGGRPADLTPEESLAADVASALTRGGVLPASIYDTVVSQLGQQALDAMIFLTVQYAAVSLMLNAYDVPSEERSSGQ